VEEFEQLGSAAAEYEFAKLLELFAVDALLVRNDQVSQVDRVLLLPIPIAMRGNDGRILSGNGGFQARNPVPGRLVHPVLDLQNCCVASVAGDHHIDDRLQLATDADFTGIAEADNNRKPLGDERRPACLNRINHLLQLALIDQHVDILRRSRLSHVADIAVQPHQYPRVDPRAVEDFNYLLWLHVLATRTVLAPIVRRNRRGRREAASVANRSPGRTMIEAKVLNSRTKPRLSFADQRVAERQGWLLVVGCGGRRTEDGGRVFFVDYRKLVQSKFCYLLPVSCYLPNQRLLRL